MITSCVLRDDLQMSIDTAQLKRIALTRGGAELDRRVRGREVSSPFECVESSLCVDEAVQRHLDCAVALALFERS